MIVVAIGALIRKFNSFPNRSEGEDFVPTRQGAAATHPEEVVGPPIPVPTNCISHYIGEFNNDVWQFDVLYRQLDILAKKIESDRDEQAMRNLMASGIFDEVKGRANAAIVRAYGFEQFVTDNHLIVIDKARQMAQEVFERSIDEVWNKVRISEEVRERFENWLQSLDRLDNNDRAPHP